MYPSPSHPRTGPPGTVCRLTCALATGPLLLALAELPAAPALLMLARAWRAFSHSGFSCIGVSMPFSLPAPATMLYCEDLQRDTGQPISLGTVPVHGGQHRDRHMSGSES